MAFPVLPPDLVERRSDERETFALINALRRQFSLGSVAPTDAHYWVSQANALLTGAVNMGALTTGVIQQTVTAGISTPSALTAAATLIPFFGAAGLLITSADLSWTDLTGILGLRSTQIQSENSSGRLLVYTNGVAILTGLQTFGIRLPLDDLGIGTAHARWPILRWASVDAEILRVLSSDAARGAAVRIEFDSANKAADFTWDVAGTEFQIVPHDLNSGTTFRPLRLISSSARADCLVGPGFVKADATGLLSVDTGTYVLSTRTISTTAPLRIDGGASASLAADRTLSIDDFVASGASHARGAVPDPGGSAGTTKFLREDATWIAPNATKSMVFWINRVTFSSASSAAFISTYSTSTQSLPDQWPTRYAYSQVAVYLNISTNTGTGAGTWKVTVYKNGSSTAATSGNISLGTTGLVDGGIQTVSVSAGDVLGLVLDGSALTGTISIALACTVDFIA